MTNMIGSLPALLFLQRIYKQDFFAIMTTLRTHSDRRLWYDCDNSMVAIRISGEDRMEVIPGRSGAASPEPMHTDLSQFSTYSSFLFQGPCS
jgi:hypothetical protein